MRPKYTVTLTADERHHLEDLISSGKHSARTITRARILLETDCGPEGPGEDDDEIVAALDTSLSTVHRVRERCDYEYRREGVANLFMFSEPLAGRREVNVSQPRTRVDWAEAMRELVDVQVATVHEPREGTRADRVRSCSSWTATLERFPIECEG